VTSLTGGVRVPALPMGSGDGRRCARVQRNAVDRRATVRYAALVVFALAASVAAAQVGPATPPTDPIALKDAPTENFSTAAIPRGGLISAPAEVVDQDEEAEYTQDFLRVQWRPGDPIYLYVNRPTKVKKPPVVIYLYGYPSESDIFTDGQWCSNTTAGGYASVGFVPYLTGHRYHDVPMKEWFVSDLKRSLAATAHDVEMVLNYLAERGDVDMDNVGVFGVGAGATIAVMAASVDPRIKAIELVDPWGDWPMWLAKSKLVPDEERADYVKAEFLKGVADFDPVTLLPKLKTPRVSMLQRSDDVAITPEEAKKQMESALPVGAENRRFQSTSEFNTSIAADGHHAYDWLKAQLKSAGTTSVDAGSKRASGSGTNGSSANKVE
jgi:pimeloyl-ACP methyl ester carboxylesterase